MCWCLYKSLSILHGFLSIYEFICGLVRLGIFFTNTNNNSTNENDVPSQLQQVPQITAAFIIDGISSLIPTMMGLFTILIFLWFCYRLVRLYRTNNNCHLGHVISSKPIERFLLFNCNCPCYIACPKWRFLIRCVLIIIILGLRFLAIVLYATAPTYNNSDFSKQTQQLVLICAITLPSIILTLLLDYYHFRVWWHYVPFVDRNPFYQRYSKKHQRFIPYHLMGENRNEMQLWTEPCRSQQFCPNRSLEHVLIFHFNTHSPIPRWSDIPNRDQLTATYIAFHRTDPPSAVHISYKDFLPSPIQPQMLGFGIYFMIQSIIDIQQNHYKMNYALKVISKY